jgi:hypothetical protein
VYNQLGCHKEASSFFRSLSSSVFGKSSKYLATANLEGDYDQQGTSSTSFSFASGPIFTLPLC